MKTIYICEVCGKKSKRDKDILICERNHARLTYKENSKWLELQDNFKRTLKMLGCAESEEEENKAYKEFKRAGEELFSFEIKHESEME